MDMQIFPGINRLLILLTRLCQLKCKYCHLTQENINIDGATLNRAVDLLLNGEKESVEIQFFGGEPLLRLDLIKKTVFYAKEKARSKGKDVRWSINTNGILLDNKTLYFLKQHNFYILFNLNDDIIVGITKKHSARTEQNRYKKILSNLNLLIDSRINYRVYFVLTPDDIMNVRKDLEYLYKLGIQGVFLIYEVGVFWSPETISKLFSEIHKFAAGNNALDFIINSRKWEGDRIISPEFAVDCDGKIYFVGGLLLENKFKRLKNKFYLGSVNKIKNLNEIIKGASDIRSTLLNTYQDNSKFKKIILSNLKLYSREKELVSC